MAKDDAGEGSSTIVLPEVQVSADHHRVSGATCKQLMDQVKQETDQATSKADPIARNKDITAAYKKLAGQCPDNRWIKLGSYVSAQAGCAMQTLSGTNFSSIAAGRFFDTGQAVQGLGDINKSIFSAINPYAAFACKNGVDKLKECYGDKLPPKLKKAFDQLQAGDKKGAALSIAQYEQTEVVPPLYQQYGTTFQGIESARSFSSHIPFTSDPASIPLSYECSATPTIPFNGSINNTNDRVNYYNSIYNAAFPN